MSDTAAKIEAVKQAAQTIADREHAAPQATITGRQVADEVVNYVEQQTK